MPISEIFLNAKSNRIKRFNNKHLTVLIVSKQQFKKNNIRVIKSIFSQKGSVAKKS
jgi:hypothetical protein